MTLLSMTGFGAATVDVGPIQLTVELRSVNHRFLDVVTKLPNVYAAAEGQVVKILKEELKRGRVEVFVNRADRSEPSYSVQFNRQLFDTYLEQVSSALEQAGLATKTVHQSAALQILQRREVLEVVRTDPAAVDEQPALERALREALAKLVAMRAAEGVALKAELLSHVEAIEKASITIDQIARGIPLQFKERLAQRLERISVDTVDPQRLAQEVAILADKADITEELVRLRSHLEQFRKVMTDGEGGRKLEFLLQEMGREVNTTGSKSQSTEITNLVVECKASLEKLKEQVANVE